MRPQSAAVTSSRRRLYPLVPLSGLVLIAFWLAVPTAQAQNETPNENLQLTATSTATWSDGMANVVQLEGNVSIQLDQTRLTADGAVIWLTPIRGAVLEELRAEISLVGHAALTQPDGIGRSGDNLFVTAAVRGAIRITADQRAVRDQSNSDLYKQAVAYRPVTALPATSQPSDEDWLTHSPWLFPPTSQPTTQPATQPAPPQPTSFSADSIEGVKTSEGLVAFVLEGNVKLFQSRARGEFLELQADRAVLFTPLRSLREMDPQHRVTKPEEAITGAYLEGDVRIVNSPPEHKKGGGEQRLSGNRVYYDFTTDRAILTDAVVHTLDTKNNVPLIIRAKVVRQLSEGEYTAERAQLTTSSFNTPSYAIGIQKAYIRQVDTGDPRYGTYSEFYGKGVTFRAYDVPLFYFPAAAGTFTERGDVLRTFEINSSSRYGTGLVTRWGLFESLGKIPPLNTDITYNLDYFNGRGPAGGFDGRYQGGQVNDTTKEPWSFSGDFTAFYIDDHGKDDLGKHRIDVEPTTENRGRIWARHTQYLGSDWEVQVTAAYASDPTFLEEWFPHDFFERGAEETSLYVKHQHDTEALTFLVSGQLDNFVTSTDFQQEQAEINRLPEIGYRRIGDSLAGDSLTAFSENVVSGLEFRRSQYTLAQQGFTSSESPGLPSYGTTGEPGNEVFRGDFRQELDYPFTAGQFRLVPYVIGRYTVYSDSPDSAGSKNRLYVGAGVRVSTAFWKVDDTVQSDLFDLHRLRHVVEPYLNLFTSAENVNRDRLLQYDEQVDEINDITGAKVGLSQRWQTKRGGADRWRSVDVFELNLEGNFFTHKPNDALINPTKFRGLFFDSLPEASIPRNSINADATWRVSDTTAVLSDAQYNLDQSTLATGSVGLAVQRGDRLSYFLGFRYIEPLSSDVATVAAAYQLTSKYQVGLRQSFDFGNQHSVYSSVVLVRHFDRFYMAIGVHFDEVGGDSGFTFNVYPEGLGKASAGAAALGSVVGGR